MSMGLGMISGSVHPHFNVDEMAGLNDCINCDPATRTGPVDMFTMPLPNYALSGERADNPMLDIELGVVPNTGSLAGVFDFLKPAKVKAPQKDKMKRPAPAPMVVPPAPAPKPPINSFVDQYGKYIVVGVGAVAIVAVIALLMTKKA